MKSRKRGSGTSAVEVFQVSQQGFWFYLEAAQKEYFVPFRQFPWFQDATYRQLSRITIERDHILSWPDLDVDLDLERIEHPERFPLVSREGKPRANSATTSRSTRRKGAAASG